MPDKKIYSKVMRLKTFCERYLGVAPRSNNEMRRIFEGYKTGEQKIRRDVKIKGQAIGSSSFATKRTELERINSEGIDPEWIKKNPKILKWSKASVVRAVLGLEIRPCNDVLVIHFWALDNEVREPTKEDAHSYENWSPGGRTKNLITESTDDGVEEVVIEPLLAVDRIINVDYMGHVDYNL